mmetsp:Transcript_156/g.396  ORF Transcript_156/g.396 Transcript_156/m.396 type:complete len:214 (+) Transcript_156:392-1033(+)
MRALACAATACSSCAPHLESTFPTWPLPTRVLTAASAVPSASRVCRARHRRIAPAQWSATCRHRGRAGEGTRRKRRFRCDWWTIAAERCWPRRHLTTQPFHSGGSRPWRVASVGDCRPRRTRNVWWRSASCLRRSSAGRASTATQRSSRSPSSCAASQLATCAATVSSASAPLWCCRSGSRSSRPRRGCGRTATSCAAPPLRMRLAAAVTRWR